MTRLIGKRRRRDDFLNRPPFPLAGALLGLIAVANVASVTILLSVL